MNASERITAHIVLIAAAGLAWPVLAATPIGPAVEATVGRAMEIFDVPGMIVTVVRSGETTFTGGYGISDVETGTPVDDRTLFQIGSVSKAFTAAALAVLADEGELGWEDPVIDHLPEFRMHDPWVTRELTIRDLLTHRSGLPLGAGDLLMFPDGNATPGEVVRALRHLRPASSFRSEFAYDNLLYIVAGEVVARASGMPFVEFLERRVLSPLGMDRCAATASRVRQRARLATPHVAVDGELATTSTRVTDLAAAAGGIACDARGMARWMSAILAEGATGDGTRLVSRTRFRELIEPVTLLEVPDYLAEHAGAYLNAYALGWGVSTFHGRPMLSHGGGVWGVTTFLAVLPDEGLAVFASGNNLSAAPRAVVHALLEQLLDDSAAGGDRDWLAILSGQSSDRQAAAERTVIEAFAARNGESAPSLPLEAYAGTYRDAWYGEIRISLKEGRQLWFESARNPPLEGPLEHFQYDTFVARWSDRQLMADAYVTFSLAPDGRVEAIRMQAVSPATDFSFDFHDLDLRRLDDPAGG